LTWSEEGVPLSAAFGDVYFSREGGLAESEAVFLAGCGLPEAWEGRAHFSVLELGFGAGVNFLALWKLWRAHRPANAILHFTSIEAFPLDRADAARALQAFPEAADLSARLLARWPVRCRAPQRIWFEEDGLALTLVQDEAASVLPRIDGPFDAFFLDGFAPACNPALWSEDVFRNLARLAAPGAYAATFTVAGAVRRGLEAAGFAPEKKPGFGKKRERLEARFVGAAPVIKDALALYPRHRGETPGRIAILGAGIAGAAMAHALTRRGIEAIVLDASPSLGAGASGNPAGLVMPRMDRGGALAEMFIASYLYAVAAYEKLGAPAWDGCGIIERAEPRRVEAFADLLHDPPLPADWLERNGDAALHARAGVLRPKLAIEAWLKNVTLMLDAPIAGLKQSGEGWLLIAPDGKARLKADAIVLACGASLQLLDVARFLPLSNVKGQIEWGPLAAGDLTRAIVQSSYAAPCEEGLVFGATFDRDGSLSEAEAREKNLEQLARLAPDLKVKHDALVSRASIRATLPDFAPVAGLLPHAENWLEVQKDIVNGRPNYDAAPPALNNLYVLGGLGARGLTLSPLLAEEIAAEICGEPAFLSRPARALIHPARFLHRMARSASGKV
jgi:tRNA 5-methylaminomethyl-2-thiouridine biosynthesis bifunctional protein